MELTKFKESNCKLGGDDTEFDIHKTFDENGRVIFCWKLNLFDRIVLLFTGRIWQQSLLYGCELQETAITIGKPYMYIDEN